MKTKLKTTQITTLGLMMAILLLMAYTPLGYLNIGPLAITFNVIPVAISAIVLGPAGGAAAGSIFGLTSFLQCIGIGGQSLMGVALFNIKDDYLYKPIEKSSDMEALLCKTIGGYSKRNLREEDYINGYKDAVRRSLLSSHDSFGIPVNPGTDVGKILNEIQENVPKRSNQGIR